jgi:hypothetical protein
MFTRKTILALATFAALGTTALAPTSASAWGHGGGHFGGHFGGGHFGGHFGGHWGGGHWGGGQWGHWGGGHWGGWRWNRGYAWGWRYRPGCWRFRYCGGPSYGGYGGGGGGDYSPQTTAYSAPASGPTTSSAGCLAKGYMPDGSVVFTDRCTNEGAVAPAGDNGPPQGGPPQGGPRR